MRHSDRMLVVGLDGVEISYAEELMEAGEMPRLAALRDRSASFLLENPPEQRTGLEWEQFASALRPERSGRESMITFDPATYEVHQDGARFEPFLERVDARTVVLDAPYFDLQRAPASRGLVGWGAHDPGTPADARPASLAEAVGPYPSTEAIYGLPWPSSSRCERLGAALVAGLEARGEAAVRLMTELTPDWDIFVAVAGEPHTASEAFWHGIDAGHPLHDHSSSRAARDAMRDIHRALDEFVGHLLDAVGDDVLVVVFNMGGMGPNTSDVPSMVLLPELLHRWAYGTALLEPRPDWTAAPDRVPLLGADESWGSALFAQLPAVGRSRYLAGPARALPAPVLDQLRRARDRLGPRRSRRPGFPLSWMPAARYAHRWSGMDAFALPAYYQGRVRVNLQGRERRGRVPPDQLHAVLDEIEDLVRGCHDPRTGDAIVAGFDRPSVDDPVRAPPDHADLVVRWKGMPAGLEHPELGLVGPVPYRRTGGHTGAHGFCFVAGPNVARHGYRHGSAFDVAPTVAALAGGHLADGSPLVDVTRREG